MDTTANQVSQWGDKLITYLIENGPKLLGALAILIAGFLVARAIGKIVESWLNKKDMEPPVRMLIGRIVRLVIIAFALIIALGTCGVDIAPMVAGIGVAGVGVGLAMQGVLGNLISGLVIIFTKPFRVGEYIEIIGCNGQVTTIELFSTVLAHPDRSRVIIPNRKIVGEVLHNYGVIRQHNIRIGVAYDTNLPEAIAAIQGILDKNSKILKEPAPVVAVGSFGDSAIEIGINPWSQLSEFGGASAELKLAIVEAFRARRIEIPFPQREVRVLNGKMLS
jgi:small conductance mechanosensitive channel